MKIVAGPWPKGTLVYPRKDGNLLLYSDSQPQFVRYFNRNDGPLMWLGIKHQTVPPEYTNLDKAQKIQVLWEDRIWFVYLSANDVVTELLESI